MYSISVIIPTFNRQDYISNSIESVLNQKGQGLKYEIVEILIVDDCSSDNTGEIVKNMEDSRIIYHKLPQNGGAAAARNAGVNMAKGEWVAFQDSDDLWHEDKLKKQTDYIDLHPDVALVSHPIRAFFADGSEFCTGTVEEEDPVVCLADRNYYDTPTMLVKKDKFCSINGFNTELKALEDWDFALRFADKYKMGMVSEALLDADMVVEGVSADASKYYESRCRMIAENRDIFISHGCFDAAMKSLLVHAQKNDVLDGVGRMLELYLKQVQ